MLTIKQIFDLGIKMAVKTDPRGEKGVKEHLNLVKKDYDKARPEDKKYFDKERLLHPYADSRIHIGNGETPVQRAMVGIDIAEGEILLASQLNERGKKIDLVIAHHPTGKSLAELHEVMDMQIDFFENAGVPIHIAEKIMEERIKEVGRGTHAINHFKVIDMARLLKVNLMNTHTITDNLVTNFLTTLIARKKPRVIGDLLDLLLEIPEYDEAKKRGAGPKIVLGSPKNRIGKYIIEMTGGTNPSDKVYDELSRCGVSTIVGMHMRETTHIVANDTKINVVIAGHMASDSLGMNLFLDELEKKGIDIVACGGLIRVSRVKK